METIAKGAQCRIPDVAAEQDVAEDGAVCRSAALALSDSRHQVSHEPETERKRRWQLALGEDSQSDLPARIATPRGSLGSSITHRSRRKSRGGLGASSPRVARWLGDIREFFPTSVVQIIQRDAFERLNLKSLMLEPEFLATLEADVHLVADLISLRSAIPEKTNKEAYSAGPQSGGCAHGSP